MGKTSCAAAVLTLVAGCTILSAQGNAPLVTVNENGVGTLAIPGISSIPLPGVLAADPGPGGLPAALTYDLMGPPSLVVGDLLLLENAGAVPVLSDVIRFNAAGTGSANYPASLVFYSDMDDVPPALADTGFPTQFYTNTVTLLEVGPEGNNGIVYTPTANQPGFVAGFSVTYHIISDESTVPEPASAWLTFAAVAYLAVGLRRARRHQVQ